MADPTADEVHAALAVLAAAEAAREAVNPVAVPSGPVKTVSAELEQALFDQAHKAAETEHVTAQATAADVPVDSEPVSPAAPSKSVPPATTYVSPQVLSRFTVLNDAASAYLSWHPANEATQHEADAEFRAFDQAQLGKLNKALYPAT